MYRVLCENIARLLIIFRESPFISTGNYINNSIIIVMVMMTLFRNYRPPPAGSTPDQTKAGPATHILKPNSLGIRPELLLGRYARTRLSPKPSSRVSAYCQAEGSQPHNHSPDISELPGHSGYPLPVTGLQYKFMGLI